MNLKQTWARAAARIDALSQRERLMVFAGVLAVIAYVGQNAVLAPMQSKEAKLKEQITQRRAGVVDANAAIEHQIAEAQVDPDLALRNRLTALRRDTSELDQKLRAMQGGLVAPERMGPLLEAMLRANGRLKLVSMRTLPVTPLNDMGKAADDQGPPATSTAAAANPPSAVAGLLAQAQPPSPTTSAPAAATPAGPAAAAQPAAPAPDLLFRHGIEITMRGSYLDMVDAMGALENLPAQLLWGKAQLDVEQYPTARLTLTLYTLSLDPKWMKL